MSRVTLTSRPEASSTIQYLTAQAAVVEQLRREIVSGALAPGTRLLQTELAERMRLSTTPIREALRELATEGLLRVDPHKGVIVHEPTLEELVEMYEIRILVEPTSMARAVRRITPDELASVTQLLKDMERTKDPGDWALLNRDFHGRFVLASRSPRMIALLNNLGNLSAHYVAISLKASPHRIQEGNREHRAILEACRRRDTRQVTTQVRHHLESTVDLLRSRLKTETRA